MPLTERTTHLWDPELSYRETYFVGAIFVHWASMEHEVFMQTLSSFVSDGSDLAKLPKEMNNLQFTGVLDLWKERVVERAKGKRRKVLLEQHETISKLKTYRDALSHGMWHWSPEHLGTIRTVRVKKREVITSRFSVTDLEKFALKIAEVNFNIRFPRGLTELALALTKQGGHISRRALASFTNAPVDQDSFPKGHPGAAAKWAVSRLKCNTGDVL